MKTKPTIFVVTDVETTMKDRVVFDVAWIAVDRKGREYGSGSYLSTDSVNLDAPWFRDKVGKYYREVYNHKIEPVKFEIIRFQYNRLISNLQASGHNVVFAAYNAAFDSKELGKTSLKLTGKPFLAQKMPLLDIWHYWAKDCPRNYSAHKTESGKNLSTTAESVYRFEMLDESFIEHHIAYYDVQAEKDILLKVLRRKKKMPLVYSPLDFAGNIWKIANERIRKSPGVLECLQST